MVKPQASRDPATPSRPCLLCTSCTLLALAPYPVVLADAPPSALLALASYPIVLADARPSALLALAPSPSVLADAGPSALLALAPSPIVLADASPAALLAEMPLAVVRAPRSTLLERSTLCLLWLFPPAAPLFRFSIGCRPITAHVFVPCRLVFDRHGIGTLERPGGSQLQQSVARCSGREASVHAPLRAAPDPCAASACDVFADPRKGWRRALSDWRNARASGRGHPHSRNCQRGRKCGKQEEFGNCKLQRDPKLFFKKIRDKKNRPRFPPARTPGLSCKRGSPRGGGPGGARDTARARRRRACAGHTTAHGPCCT